MMKYTSTIKSRQFILADDKKKIFIEPGKGEMSEHDAITVAKSQWGKHLIEAGSLTFERIIEVKDETVDRGMTIPKEEQNTSDKSSADNEGDEAVVANTNNEADEIPDFDLNKNSEEGVD
jgi:hypothetical protein